MTLIISLSGIKLLKQVFGTPTSTFTCDANKLPAPVPLLGPVYRQLRRSRAGDPLACRGVTRITGESANQTRWHAEE